MKLINIEAIKVAATRQRREFKQDKIQELVSSITQFGLMHPLVLRQEGEDYVLVAGERRLRAVQDLHGLNISFNYDGSIVRWGTVPYVTLGELDPLAAEEAELEENIRRVDLTWQERDAALLRLTNLRRKQSAAAGAPAPTTADIAMETRGSAEGSNQEATRQSLIVAAHLDDPEIRSAKSSSDAFKLLKRKEASARANELATTVGRTFTSEVHRIFNTDSRQWLRECSAEVFDVILTDPPYGIGADEFSDSGRPTTMGEHFYSDTVENFQSLMDVFIPHSFRVAKPAAHLYCFCDIDWFMELRERFSNAGWTVHRTPLIWFKPAAFRAPWPEHGPQRKYELLLYAVKGDRKVTKLMGDVLQYPPDENLGHPAQKPIALIEDLLKRSALPGDSVLDPFCGSGPIFPAAHGLKLRATGIEADTAAYGLAVGRINKLKEAA